MTQPTHEARSLRVSGAAAFAVASLLAGGSGAQEAALRPEPVTVEFAITQERPLAVDLYVPEGDGPFPVVVYVFGGAWRAGDRAQVRDSLALGLLDRGYAVAAVDYRLSHESIFPSQIIDVKTAICFLRRKASEYRLDPERVGIWGPSAGGHLAALAGTSGAVEALEGAGCEDSSSRVRAVVDFYGPTDFLQMDAHSLSDRIVHDDPGSPESRLVGAPIQESPDLVARANPITYVTADDPPFLLVHGDSDPLVPLHQSELLHRALLEAGLTSELVRVEGGGHGMGGTFGTPGLFERVAQFFDRHLKP